MTGNDPHDATRFNVHEGRATERQDTTVRESGQHWGRLQQPNRSSRQNLTYPRIVHVAGALDTRGAESDLRQRWTQGEDSVGRSKHGPQLRVRNDTDDRAPLGRHCVSAEPSPPARCQLRLILLEVAEPQRERRVDTARLDEIIRDASEEDVALEFAGCVDATEKEPPSLPYPLRGKRLPRLLC